MKEKRTVFAAVAPAICACGLAVITAGCSPEWIAGGAPETPPGAYIEDPAPEVIPGKEEVANIPPQKIELPQTPVVIEPEDPVVQILTPEGGEVKVEEPVQPTPPPAQPAQPAVKEIVYTVCKGDTLSGIGESYGADWRQIAAYNKLDVKSVLRVNQQIRIPENLIRQKGAKALSDVKNLELKPVAPTPAPEKKAAAPVPEKKVEVQPQAGQKIHVVESGDMLSKLAVKYGVSAAAIAKANGIEMNSMLRLKQKLVIPPADPNFAKKRSPKAAAPKKAAAAPVKTEKTEPAKKDAAPILDSNNPPSFGDAAPAETPAPAEKTEDAPAPPLPDDDSAPEETSAPAISAPAAQSTGSAASELSYSTTAYKGATLRSIARDMNANLDKVLKLNPGIDPDQKFDAPRQILMPLE